MKQRSMSKDTKVNVKGNKGQCQTTQGSTLDSTKVNIKWLETRSNAILQADHYFDLASSGFKNSFKAKKNQKATSPKLIRFTPDDARSILFPWESSHTNFDATWNPSALMFTANGVVFFLILHTRLKLTSCAISGIYSTVTGSLKFQSNWKAFKNLSINMYVEK